MFISNVQERDTLFQNGLKDGHGVYDAGKIVAILAKYDLIIYTQSGVIDTTKYNMAHKETGVTYNATVIVASQNGDSIQLTYNPVAHGTAIQEGKLNEKCRAVAIPVKTIEKIIVKGKRNFLQNRTPKDI